MYKGIKKEHVFIFLVLFSGLVLINYFLPDSYTGYVSLDSCSSNGYECCNVNEGEGVYHFSLDDSCPQSQECWDSCPTKSTNQITGNSVFTSAWNWITSIFTKETVAGGAWNNAPIGTIFVTSEKYNGKLNGLNGADDICQSKADNADLNGVWKSLLGGRDVSEKDNIHTALQNRILYGYEFKNSLTQGFWNNKIGERQTVAEGYSQLFFRDLDYRINYDENGNAIDANDCKVWSGKSASDSSNYCYGRQVMSDTPQDWGVYSPRSTGSTGDCSYINAEKWYSDDRDTECNENHRLYCIKVGNDDEEVQTPPPVENNLGIETSPDLIEFGEVNVGESIQKSVRISNKGDSNIQITNIKTGERQYDYSTNGEIITPIKVYDSTGNENNILKTLYLNPSTQTYQQGFSTPITINSDDSIIVRLYCTPNENYVGEEISAKLYIEYSNNQTKTIDYRCNIVDQNTDDGLGDVGDTNPSKPPRKGIAEIEISGNALTNGELIFSTPVDIVQQKSFYMYNVGTADLVISNIKTDSRGYSIAPEGVDGKIEVIKQIEVIDSNIPSNNKIIYPNTNNQSYSAESFGTSITIPQNDGMIIKITCQPNAAQPHIGQILITYNGNNEKRINYNCQGTGSDDANPPEKTIAKPSNFNAVLDGNKVSLSWKYIVNGVDLCRVSTGTTGGAVTNIITGNTVAESIGNFFSSLWNSIFGTTVGQRQDDTGANGAQSVVSFEIQRNNVNGNNDKTISTNIASRCNYADTIDANGRYKYRIRTIIGMSESDWTAYTSEKVLDSCLRDDGEPYCVDQGNSPEYCSENGQIVNKASLCGCPVGKVAQGDNCVLLEEDCTGLTNDKNNNGIISAFECKKYSIQIDDVIPEDESVYTFSQTNFDCEYTLLDENDDEINTIQLQRGALNCFEGSIINNENEYVCEDSRLGSNKIEFTNCYVGEEENDFVQESCKISNLCKGDSLSVDVEATKYDYCDNDGDNEILAELSNIDIDYDDKIVEITGELEAILDEDQTFEIKGALINLKTGKIESEESTTLDYVFDEGRQDFDLEVSIPSNLDGNYYLFIKAYPENSEHSTCVEYIHTEPIELEGDTSLIDNDEDGYIADEDCNDNDAFINPGVAETGTLCEDLIDNNCNELIDNEDPQCLALCTEGQLGTCTVEGMYGACSIGERTCISDGVWGECIQTTFPSDESCNDNVDNNCNGQIDEGCSGSVDSDNDGLLDSWELQYFGNLFQGPNDDFDNDGYSNVKEYNKNTDPTDPQSKPVKGSNLTWLWILLILIFILAIVIVFRRSVFGFFGNIFHKKSNMSSQEVDPRLRSYVSSALAKGFTKQQVKQALVSKGWNSKDIDKVLR